MASRIISVLLLGTLLASPLCAEKLRLGVVPFKEVGQVPKGAGQELAAFVSGLLGEHYRVKERLQLSAVLQENLLRAGGTVDPDELKAQMRQFGVDVLFLGQISRTAGDYSLFVRISDLSGTIGSFRSTVQASQWESLKDRLQLRLIQHGLVPVRFRVRVDLRFSGEVDPQHVPTVHLQGARERYTLRRSGEVVPGRYRVEVVDQRYQPYQTWIEIKPGQKPKTLEIKLKTRGLNIHLILEYGGVSALLLVIIYTLLRMKLKRKVAARSAVVAPGDLWQEALEQARGLENECVSLVDRPAFAPLAVPLTSLKQEANALVGRVEMLPQSRRQERVLAPVCHAIEELRREMSLLTGLVQGGAVAKAVEKVEEIIRRVRHINP